MTWYLDPALVERDLDPIVSYYNLERSHHGYRLKDRTPVRALREALGVEGPIVPRPPAEGPRG